MKLLALDGNSIINRAFYGIKLLSTKDGKFTNAVYGFINILNRLCELEKPDGVAVAFDLREPTFRHKKYVEYKAGRKPMPQELASQFPILKEWLNKAGYICIECAGFEADDILGTLAHACDQSGNECVIATGDRDSLQLISDKTRVLLAATKMGHPEIIDYTTDALFEKYGLTPPQMIELKALMGDSSDNIPGVAGVGEKTATDLIKRFGSIDYIYENIDTLDIKEGVRAKLISGKDSAFLSRELGTICRTAPIDLDINSYKTRERNDTALANFMAELEFFSLIKKMGLTPDFSAKPQVSDDTVKYSFGDSLPAFSKADIYIEDGNFAVVSEHTVYNLTETQLSDILKNPNVIKRVYDYKNLLKRFDKTQSVQFDAMLAGYLCNPSASDYSCGRLIEEYCKTSIDTVALGDSDFLKSAASFSLCCDALEATLKETNQLELLEHIEVPLARVLCDMENIGFLVDCEGLKSQGEIFAHEIAQIQNEIYSLAGCEFNINSPKQLGEVLFVKLCIPTKKKTKSGFSTSADVLEGLRYDYPIVDLCLKYRQLAKLKSTYCDGLLAAAHDNGRIHSTFNQTEARTGRISSTEPNLQNIPVRTEQGKILRRFFKAKDGFVLCDADYSQIELRVLASIADDTVMIDAFNNDIDIHTATASEVFNIPVDMVLPVMRSRAKAVNFGIVYGIGAFSLAKDIGVSRKEADSYIKGYLDTYKGVAKYMDSVIESAKQQGFVTTHFGRRRYLPELSSSNGMLRAFGERVARNAPIQGTAADIIKIAMIKVSQRLKSEIPEARLILQVHDELIVEAPEEKAQQVCTILEEEMRAAADLKVALSVDAHFGKDWLSAKG